MKLKVHGATLEVYQGDITESATDAIVNASNSELILGAGVAGAIRKKGGPVIQEELNALGRCPVGGAVITSGGHLKARYVIHAVGPRMGEGNENGKLRRATLSGLRLAEETGLASVTFPAVSTGIFGFPLPDCARIMLGAVREHLSGDSGLELVRFALYDAEALQVFENQLARMAGGEGGGI